MVKSSPLAGQKIGFFVQTSTKPKFLGVIRYICRTICLLAWLAYWELDVETIGWRGKRVMLTPTPRFVHRKC